MEEYKFKLNRTSLIKYGEYKDLVYGIHENKYGKDSADRILNKSTLILKESIIQKNNPELSNNSLIVGKVQSGKTSNLEMITALAFDNGFNLLVIYGGYDNTLLDQCIKRFHKVFDPDYDGEKVNILSNYDNTINVIDDNFIETCVKEKTPIIVIGLKRPVGLDPINEVLSKIDTSKVNAFIIDDEGDQASLNVAKDKLNEASSTYAAICKMKTLLGDPIYFPVTATPMAIVFSPNLSALRPDSLHLVYPGEGYTGAETFHLLENQIVNVPNDDIDILDENRMPDSLEKALKQYILSSAIMLKKGEKKTCMIIHSYREVVGHKMIHSIVDKYFDMLRFDLENGYEEILFNVLQNVFDELYSENIRDNFTIEDIKDEIVTVVKNTKIVIRNSENKEQEESLKFYKHVIHIGGDLLQRGITFDNLVTTYFTRWSLSGNMDTSLQRARWFGYRINYLELCKIFLPRNVQMEFANLASIENDLWDQFEQIENGELSINDIVIDADDTSLRPARYNAIDVKKIAFNKKWFNQRIGIFDINQIKNCNSSFDKLMQGENILLTQAGRTNNTDSARYFSVSVDKFINFIESNDYIFNQPPYSIYDIKHVLKDEDSLNIVLMFEGPRKPYRNRTFNNGTVSALQQGADALDPNDKNYLGDAYVIPDRNKVTIQVFKVQPDLGDDQDINEDLRQYMFSIHVPQKRTSYVRRPQ